MKVIIIGAGLAGLTFALVCQQASLEVKIYDKAKKLRPLGGGIVLWPQGLRYLEWLNLAHIVKPFQIPIERCQIVGHHGQKVFCEEYAEFYSLINGSILPLDRSNFQNALLKDLHPNTLQLNKACTRVVSDTQRGEVYFQDGTMDKADLIIGADGINSLVRQSFNSVAMPQYTHYCWWGGIIKQKYLAHLSAENVHFALGQGKICVIWPAHDKNFIWYLPVKMPYQDLKNKKLALDQLQSLFADWQPDLHPLIHQTSYSKSFHVPIFSAPSHHAWTHHRIALIGDAAHALGPVLGQGVSQAVEDAYVLINCLLKEPNNMVAMLQLYEDIRRPRCEKITELENWAASVLLQENLQELELLQQQIQQTSLALMYHDLIPLINEQSSLEVAKLFA